MSRNRYFGYARVSTNDQNLESQIDQIRTSGFPIFKIFADKVSAKDLKRSEFKNLLQEVQPGDTIVFTDLSRITRSTKDMLELLQQLEERKVFLKALNQNFINTSEKNPFNKMLIMIVAALAELERDMIRERTRVGLESARNRGRLGGRPKTNPKDVSYAIMEYKKNIKSVGQICKEVGISESTLYRYLRAEKSNIEKN